MMYILKWCNWKLNLLWEPQIVSVVICNLGLVLFLVSSGQVLASKFGRKANDQTVEMFPQYKENA